MQLAKQHIDVGFFAVDLDAMLRFWREEVGLPFEETLPLGGGLRQHRHALNGSVFKLNHSREPLAPAPLCGYRQLTIAREGLAGPRALTDPEGNRVLLVPPGAGGVTGIGVHLAVRDEAAFDRFYRETLQLEPAGDRAYRWGDSVITFALADDAVAVEAMNAPGFRYLTVQVWDVEEEHRGFLARGAREGSAPRTLGSTARISFIRDPDGNWIEVSQRASLTGPLPG